MLLRHRRHDRQLAPRDSTEREAIAGATHERLVKELTLLRRVSTALAREREVGSILQTAVATCRELFGFEHVAIGTIEGDHLVRRGHDGTHDVIQRLPISAGVSGRVARSGVAELVRDAMCDPDYVPNSPEATTQSMIAVPITAAANVIGVLVIESDETKPLEEEDLRLAGDLAEQVGFALERAQMDEDRRASSERYRTLIDQSPAVLYEAVSLGSDAGFRFVSAHVQQISGYPPSEWAEHPVLWRELVHPDDRTRRNEALAHANRIGVLHDIEYRLVAKDGHIRWVRERATTCIHADGSPPFWQGIVFDVSAARENASERELREQAEAAKAEAEEARAHLARTLESVTDGFIALDNDWRFTFLNTNAALIARSEPQDLIGKVIWEEFPELLGSEFEACYRLAVREGRPGSVIAFYEPFQIWVDARIYPFDSGMALYFRDITEQQGAAEALRRSEDRYRVLVEQLPAVTYVQPATGTGVTYVSPQIEELTGYPVERFHGEPNLWSAICHPDDVERVRQAEIDSDAHGTPFVEIYRVIHADGRVIWVSDRTVPLRDPGNNEIHSWQGLTLDITVQYESQQKLAEAEKQYRALVEQLPSVVFQQRFGDSGSNGTFSYISPQVEDLAGVSPSALFEDPNLWERLVVEGDPWLADDVVGSEAGNLEPFVDELRLQVRDGRAVWLRRHSVLLLDEQGQTSGWQGVLLDITAQVTAEQALRSAESRFASIVRHTSDVVSIHDEFGTRMWVSPSIEHVLGFSAAERVGWASGELTVPEDRDAFDRFHAAVATSPDRVPAQEFRFRHQDGSIKRLEVAGINLLADPDVDGIVYISRDVTDRRNAEARERDAERRFRTLVEQSPAAVYAAAPGEDLTFTYVSPQIESLLGYPGEQWLNGGLLFWLGTVHPGDRERVRATIYEMLRSAHGGSIEYQQLTGTGQRVWIRNEITPVRDEHGTFQYWLGVMFDISDRHRAEVARVRSVEANVARQTAEAARERLYSLVQGLDAIIWEADPVALNFTFVSDRAERTLGHPIEAWLTRPSFLSKLVVRTDLDSAISVRRNAVTFQTSLAAEYRVQGADGRISWIRDIVAAPDKDYPTWPLRGLMVDITERKLGEVALAAERDLLQVLMDTSPDLIFFKDLERRFTRVNLSFARMLGFDDPDDVLGLRDEDLYAAESVAEFRASEEQVLRDGVVITRVERPTPTRTETQHWYLTTKVPIRAADGSIQGLFGTAKEISVQRRMEDELRRARDEAESANLAKSLFVSRMSHELRTPLNAILGFAQIMGAEPLDDHQREGVDQILKAGRHLLSLINEVLELSRIESGRIAMSIEPVPLHEIVEEALALIAPLINEAGLTVRNGTNADAASVLADRQRLKQIVLNLLSNAIKYTPADGTIVVRSDGNLNRSIRLSVEDTGPGIPPEMMARLFEPFDRLDVEHAGREGSGLGLAVSQRLAEAMGLSINVDSTPGSGSTFWLELPLAHSSADRVHPAAGEAAG